MMNFWIGVTVYFRGTLHGFRSGGGIENASIETSLLQDFTAMREEVLYEVFLDLEKAYEALN